MKIITPTRRFSLQLTNEKWREPNENYYAHTPSLQRPNEKRGKYKRNDKMTSQKSQLIKT